MSNISDSDSRSPPASGGVVTRAQTDPQNDTAQPPLTSGFGAVLEKEYDLRRATEDSFGSVAGKLAAETDRILHEQSTRVAANIALLEQRYEALPNPARFVSWTERRHPPTAARRTGHRDEVPLLPDLISQHASLITAIEALIDCGPDGQRGELILTEVSRNHEEMAWMLTALLKEDATTARPGDAAEGPAKPTVRAEEVWDNEGGPARPAAPAS